MKVLVRNRRNNDGGILASRKSRQLPAKAKTAILFVSRRVFIHPSAFV